MLLSQDEEAKWSPNKPALCIITHTLIWAPSPSHKHTLFLFLLQDTHLHRIIRLAAGDLAPLTVCACWRVNWGTWVVLLYGACRTALWLLLMKIPSSPVVWWFNAPIATIPSSCGHFHCQSTYLIFCSFWLWKSLTLQTQTRRHTRHPMSPW